MPSLRTLSRLTASMLLVTAAACATDPTKGTGQAPAAAPPTEPGPTGNSTNTPPTLDLHMISGTSAGAAYSIDAIGMGFPPGKSWDAAIMAVLADGTVILVDGGSGVNPVDGSFRLIYTGHCPSRFRDVYADVSSGGRTTPSKHIVPTC